MIISDNQNSLKILKILKDWRGFKPNENFENRKFNEIETNERLGGRN